MRLKFATRGTSLSSIALIAILLVLILSPSHQDDFTKESKLFKTHFETIFQSYPPKPEDNTKLKFELSNNLFSQDTCTIDLTFDSKEVTIGNSQLTELRVSDVELTLNSQEAEHKINKFDSAKSTHNFLIADISAGQNRAIRVLEMKTENKIQEVADLNSMGRYHPYNLDKSDKVLLKAFPGSFYMVALIEKEETKGEAVLNIYLVAETLRFK